MASLVCPIMFITLPVQFENLRAEPRNYLEELGTPDSDKKGFDDFDPERDVIEQTRFQVDRVEAYARVITKSGREITLIWVDGIKFWVMLSLKEFEMVYLPKVEQFNEGLR